MGSLQRHNVQSIRQEFGLSYFVETGTYLGDSVAYALGCGFDKIYSMEVMENLHQKCIDRFTNNDNVFIVLGDTSKDLPLILTHIPQDTPTLFWLDAHFPGAHGGFLPLAHTKEEKTRIPLQTELETIKQHKEVNNDYFIIDDLRIYEDGPYEQGNWEDRSLLGGQGIEFLQEFFSDTHTINKDFRDQGYLLGIPNAHK